MPLCEEAELCAGLDAELAAVDGLSGVAGAAGGEVVVEGEDREGVQGQAVLEEAAGDRVASGEEVLEGRRVGVLQGIHCVPELRATSTADAAG